MIVCSCHGVSDRVLKSLIDHGTTNLREIGKKCHAGTDCGSCAQTIRRLTEARRNASSSTPRS
ncbi:MAG: bacterioferritin-associated ferredoxin [Myxococcota bacterium]|jgi:bacterioferritin-associated ferredoxin